MKKTTTFLAIFVSAVAFSQVGIGTTSPNDNAMLDIRSTTKGFLMPRMDTTQRNTLATNLLTTPDSLEKGMQVFDSTTNSIWYWDGTAWIELKDTNTTYTGSTSVVLNGTSFERAALTGDVTATQNSNATTVTKIQGRSVDATAPTAGQVLAWDGTSSTWKPTVTASSNLYTADGTLAGNRIVTQGTNTLAFTSSVVNGFSVGGDTFSVDALNSRVGIGSSTPLSKLFVTQPAGITSNLSSFIINNCGGACGQSMARNIVIGNANGTNTEIGSLDFVSSTISTDPSGASIIGIDRDGTNHYAGLSFFTRNATNFASRMVIKSSGNVGIANTAPTEILDVTGNIRFSGALMPNNTAGTTGQVLTSAGTGAVPTWTTPVSSNIYTADGTLAGNRIVTQGTNTLAFNSTATTGTSHFTVDGTTLNIDAVNNRMGILNAAPTEALDVTGNIRFSGALMPNNTAGTSGQVLTSAGAGAVPTWTTPTASNNIYTADGTISGGLSTVSGVTGNFRTITLGTGNGLSIAGDVTASLLLKGPQLANWADFVINANADGGATVGTEHIMMKIRGNEYMRILDGGNVGINNTAPTEKLDVTGNIRFSGALMPNNTAGTSGQVLTSAGAGTVPTWSRSNPFNIQNSTNTATANTSNAYLNGKMALGDFSASSMPANEILRTRLGDIHFQGQDTNFSDIYSTYASNTSDIFNAFIFQRSRGTLDAPTATVNGDLLGALKFDSHTGTGFQTDASFQVKKSANGAEVEFINRTSTTGFLNTSNFFMKFNNDRSMQVGNLIDGSNAVNFPYSVVAKQDGTLGVVSKTLVLSTAGLTINTSLDMRTLSLNTVKDIYFVDQNATITLPNASSVWAGKELKFYIYGGGANITFTNGLSSALSSGSPFPTGMSFNGTTMSVGGEANRFNFITFICDGGSWWPDLRN